MLATRATTSSSIFSLHNRFAFSPRFFSFSFSIPCVDPLFLVVIYCSHIVVPRLGPWDSYIPVSLFFFFSFSLPCSSVLKHEFHRTCASGTISPTVVNFSRGRRMNWSGLVVYINQSYIDIINRLTTTRGKESYTRIL